MISELVGLVSAKTINRHADLKSRLSVLEDDVMELQHRLRVALEERKGADARNVELLEQVKEFEEKLSKSKVPSLKLELKAMKADKKELEENVRDLSSENQKLKVELKRCKKLVRDYQKDAKSNQKRIEELEKQVKK